MNDKAIDCAYMLIRREGIRLCKEWVPRCETRDGLRALIEHLGVAVPDDVFEELFKND